MTVKLIVQVNKTGSLISPQTQSHFFCNVYNENWWNLEHDIDSKDIILMFYRT